MLILGKNELILRFIPAMLGTLTIPLVYLMGREANDDCTGVAAASIIAFSPFHIFYSQEARAYTTLLFFLTCTLLFFFFCDLTRTESNLHIRVLIKDPAKHPLAPYKRTLQYQPLCVIMFW